MSNNPAEVTNTKDSPMSVWFKESMEALNNMIGSAEKIIENERKRKERESDDAAE